MGELSTAVLTGAGEPERGSPPSSLQSEDDVTDSWSSRFARLERKYRNTAGQKVRRASENFNWIETTAQRSGTVYELCIRGTGE